MPLVPLLRPALAALTVVSLAASCRSAARGVRGETATAERLREDVAYLASDRLEGRGTGTAGNDSAAAWIAARLQTLGLRDVTEGYLQRFTARPAAHGAPGLALPTQNVLALLPGRDRTLRGQVVVLGAHFDHLGRGTVGALDPEARDAIRNGADDNASGTAAVLELARLLRASPPRRSVLFVLFSGEELGLLGSQYLVEHAPIPVDSMVAMVNFDMVGRLRDRKLIIYGVETAREMRALVDSANAGALDVRGVGDGFGPSDHSSFYGKQVPVLHLFTDLHADYHRASDDVDRIDAAGMAQVVSVAERIVRRIADRPNRLTYARSGAPPRADATSRTGPRPWLGTIPDMAAGDVPGLRITGVTPGSPGDQAGLRANDVIVRFAGAPITDLQSYSDALYTRKPGDKVEVVVLRAGQRLTLTVTLGQRG